MNKIITVNFDFDSKSDYSRLTTVFKKSCAYHMPNAEFIDIRIPAPDLKAEYRQRNSKMLQSNTVKLDLWVDYLLKNNDNLCLADADMLANGNIFQAFNEFEFDVALTRREDGFKLERNGGIVLVRPTENARDFLRLWQKVNLEMLNNEPFHRPYREKYGGMNQAALGYIMETGGYQAKVIDIPCRKWNCCNESWKNITDETVMIHIKGELRKQILRNYDIRIMPEELRKAAQLWRQMEVMLCVK